jgi:hypothetical protein
LGSAVPSYHFSPNYYHLPVNVFLGAVDFFYLAQQLPLDRKVTISSECGCITLIMWAHHILGLTVVLTGVPGGNVVFGNSDEQQVFITWTGIQVEGGGELFYPHGDEEMNQDQVIQLLDKDASVLVSCEPEEDKPLYRTAAERHPLTGYGTTYLRRILNVDCITPDTDPIYSEAVAIITGLAVYASQRMSRGPIRDRNFSRGKNLTTDIPASVQAVLLERWRVINSAKIIFADITIDGDKVATYVGYYSKYAFGEESLPSTFDAFLSRVQRGDSAISPAKRLIDRVKHMAKIVLLFAHVIELDKCGDMPAILTDDHNLFASVMTQLLKVGSNEQRGLVEPQGFSTASLRCLMKPSRSGTTYLEFQPSSASSSSTATLAGAFT